MDPYILVTDDNNDDLFIIKEAFQQCQLPVKVETVSTGEALLSWLADKTCFPSLILLDVNMPRLNGFEVLDQLKQAQDFKRVIPVVMFSSSHNPKDVQTSYDHGANSYLVKPADFDELVKAIDTLTHYWLDLSQSPSKFQNFNFGAYRDE